jgi:hypothetical protein
VPQSLAEIVLEEGMVDRAAVAVAADRADQLHEPLVVVLVRRHGVDELALVAAIRRHVRVAVADPANLPLDSDALRDLPRDVCRRLRVLPLSVEALGVGPRRLRLAMAEPTDLSALEEMIESAYRAFVTQVMPREREPFGGTLAVTTPALPRAAEEADLATRLRALVRLLVAKKIVGEEELDEEIRQLLKGRGADG